VRQDVLSELVRLLDNRYLLAERVYFHHAKLIAGTMIAGAIGRAMITGGIKEKDLLELGDETLLSRLQALGPEHEASARLATLLSYRKLWKKTEYEKCRGEIDSEQQRAGDLPVWDTLMTNWWKDHRARIAAEDQAASDFGLQPGDFLIYCPDKDMQLKPAKMRVCWNGEIKPLTECPDLPVISRKLKNIMSSHEQLWALKTYLNPDRFEKERDLIEFCEYQFSFNVEARERCAKKHFKNVLDEAATPHKGRLPAKEYETKLLEAVKLMSSPAQTAATPKEIIESVFGRIESVEN
jgi:HD superfamily phosphohydrolase